VHIHKSVMRFCKGKTTLFTASISERNVAYLDGKVVPAVPVQSASMVSTLPADRTLWHRRFVHLHHGGVDDLIQKEMVTGLELDSSSKPDPICEPCLAGKMHRGPIPKVAQHRADKPLGLVHSDLHGPLPVQSRRGHCYWMTFIDDESRYSVAIPLKKKSEAFDAFKRYKEHAETQLGLKMRTFRDDKGGEYMSKAMADYMLLHGIQRQHTVRNEPHQNGVAERLNRTMGEGITAMLAEARLPPSFWEYAMHAFMYVHNMSPTSAIEPGKTPYELWHGTKPDCSNLRIWGSLAYVHIQKDQRAGLQPHYLKCVFIGYPLDYKGWLFYDLEAWKEIISNTAVFDERVLPGNSVEQVPDFSGPFADEGSPG